MEGLTLAIEKFRQEKEISSYVEATVLFATEHGLDFYDLVDQIDPVLKDKLKNEYIKGNFFPDKKIEGSLDGLL